MSTTTRNTSKVIATVLAIATLFSMVFVFGNISGNVTVDAATDKVSLYSSNVFFSKYGCRSFEVFVKTNNNASEEQVTIHYNYLDTMEWQDTDATLYTTLQDGSKIWRAVFNSFYPQYAIKYVADGVTYWDNNNGKDYNGTEAIGSAVVTSQRMGYQYYTLGGFKINAILQNLGYDKNVYVRYTTDGWKTYQDKALSYNSTNDDGTETWTTYIYDNLNVLETGDFQYAICYQVNGNEYWANNFGANYNRTYYIYQ